MSVSLLEQPNTIDIYCASLTTDAIGVNTLTAGQVIAITGDISTVNSTTVNSSAVNASTIDTTTISAPTVLAGNITNGRSIISVAAPSGLNVINFDAICQWTSIPQPTGVIHTIYMQSIGPLTTTATSAVLNWPCPAPLPTNFTAANQSIGSLVAYYSSGSTGSSISATIGTARCSAPIAFPNGTSITFSWSYSVSTTA